MLLRRPGSNKKEKEVCQVSTNDEAVVSLRTHWGNLLTNS